MARKRKSKKRDEQRPGGDAKNTGARKGGRTRRGPTWMESHGGDLKFLLVFGLLMGLYYIITTFDVVEHKFFPWYLESTAKVSTGVLKATGYEAVELEGKRMRNPEGSISVERGCDAIAPTALFLSAVLASPAGFRFKWRGVLGGVLVLMIANVTRIITLFLTRVYWHQAFDVMHLDIWQGLFILLAILLWALWASWATNKEKTLKAQADAAT